MNLKLLSSFLILLLIIPVSSFASYTLTDEQYDAIIKQLEKDQKIIRSNDIIWDELKKSKPKITYEIVEDQVVIQSIEIPIKNSKPLIYQIKFKIDQKQDVLKYFPFTIQLCGMLETEALADFKIGLRLFSFAPLQLPFLQNIGFSVLVGIKSTGVSINYGLPKPLKNTAIHIYTGFSYTKTKEVFGVGVSLNF
jgi:hypothetical protein